MRSCILTETGWRKQARWRSRPGSGARAGAPAARPPQVYEGSYPHSLVKEIIPFIEKNYRVIANKDSRAIAGLSMGGGHTVQATNNNPGVFGWIAVWSAGGQDTPEFAAALTKVKNAGVKHYWVGAGTTDFALKGSETLSAVAKKVGLNTSYHTAPGAHYWFIWRQFLGEYASILFRWDLAVRLALAALAAGAASAPATKPSKLVSPAAMQTGKGQTGCEVAFGSTGLCSPSALFDEQL